MHGSTERDEQLTRVALSDPRGRSEAEWLDVLDMLVRRLEEALETRIEVGFHWFEHGPRWRDSGCACLVAKIRAVGPLSYIGCDVWEASLCMTGDEDGCGVDVMAFPFSRGSLLTREGRLADLVQDSEVEEFWVTFRESGWEVLDWKPGEGPGEWNGIRAPGDVFRLLLGARVIEDSEPGRPPLIVIEHVRGDETQLGESAWFSLHRLSRDGHEIVSPERPSSRDLDARDDRRTSANFRTLPASLALDQLPIPQGWTPGRYRAEVRLTYAPSLGVHESDITAPFEFDVR